MWPTDEKNGPQIRDMPTTNAKCNTATSKQTIYKPNNVQYGVQGAVSSSARSERLKLNASTQTSDEPYFTPSTHRHCTFKHKKGHRTKCSH